MPKKMASQETPDVHRLFNEMNFSLSLFSFDEHHFRMKSPLSHYALQIMSSKIDSDFVKLKDLLRALRILEIH
jgi:hypothetical protein